MHRKMPIIFAMIIALVSLFQISCEGSGVKIVSKVPDGFTVFIQSDGLHFIFWENVISFLDADDICIYQSSTNNKNLLVKYNDEYYIHEIIYSSLKKNANLITEQRNRVYSVGDAIILRSAEIIPYVIKLDEVVIEVSNEEILNTIKFTVNPEITDYKLRKIFDHLTTIEGSIISEFIYLDEKTAIVKTPKNETVDILTLKSPDYEKCIRNVLISPPYMVK